ncbi:MAG: hypothetical protein ACLRSW_12085 [Christensenellaceae bacterium]
MSRSSFPPPFFLFCLLFCAADRNYALKVPVKIRAGSNGSARVYLLLIACVSYIVVALLDFAAAAIKSELYDLFAFLPIRRCPCFCRGSVIGNLLDGLYENPRNKNLSARGRYWTERKSSAWRWWGATEKLPSKISSRILSAKYSVVETPESFNTPVGIAKTDGADFAGAALIAEWARGTSGISRSCAASSNPITGVYGRLRPARRNVRLGRKYP